MQSFRQHRDGVVRGFPEMGERNSRVRTNFNILVAQGLGQSGNGR